MPGTAEYGALLEANAAWGADLNGCDAAEAACCIASATLA